MKVYILSIFLFLSFSFLASLAYALTCAIRENSCLTGENIIFSLYSTQNSHAGSPNYYSYKLCCDEITASLKYSCLTDEAEILSFFQENDTHVAQPGYYPKKLCVKKPAYPFGCAIKSSCDPENEACLASLFASTNSHIANCSYYSNNLCCGKLGIVSADLNATEVWWNDPIKIEGVARWINETPITSADVNVLVAGKNVCSTSTNSTGHYSCVFKAPQSVGIYETVVKIIDPSTNEEVTSNTTSFQVKPFYGAGKEEERIAKRVGCYEVPKIIQNPDGSIKKVIVRVCVWR